MNPELCCNFAFVCCRICRDSVFQINITSISGAALVSVPVSERCHQCRGGATEYLRLEDQRSTVHIYMCVHSVATLLRSVPCTLSGAGAGA